jgi:putative endonuclease
MGKYFIYILQCKDNSYYTGVTRNVEKRVYEHQEGLVKNSCTHLRRPVKLIYTEDFSKPLDAIEREKQIKGWSRKKKEALVSGDFLSLPNLSMRKEIVKSPFECLRVTPQKSLLSSC